RLVRTSPYHEYWCGRMQGHLAGRSDVVTLGTRGLTQPADNPGAIPAGPAARTAPSSTARPTDRRPGRGLSAALAGALGPRATSGRLEQAGVAVSMDGKGRCLDNVFVERLWRSVKHEDVYLRCYETVPELACGLGRYFGYDNHERRHQSLDYQTPARVYRAQ